MIWLPQPKEVEPDAQIMNLPLIEPADMPQPRENIRIQRVRIEPYPDGWRVKLIIEATPFQERPSLEIRVRSADGRIISELSVIETMHAHMEFTVHIRGVSSPIGEYTGEFDLYYDDRGNVQDQVRVPFSIHSGQPEITEFDAR